ncbi:MAG TPA: type I polyketide synthase, partial [Thermoanaerobaculia bacterium]|nr:type I polyketide synthase [Thermoanaerobaculia bacterium]
VLTSVGGGQIDYEIRTGEGEDTVVHCQGEAFPGEASVVAPLDLERLSAGMQRGTREPEAIYNALARIGMEYGPAQRSIAGMKIGEEQLLAELRLPAIVEADWDAYELHPALFDGAFQATIGMAGDLQGTSAAWLPYALGSLRIVAPCAREMFVWVRHADGGARDGKVAKLDLDLCDRRGNVCVQLRDLSARAVRKEAGDGTQGILVAIPVWRAAGVTEADERFEQAERQILLWGLSGLDPLWIEARIARSHCVAISAQSGGLAERYGRAAEALLGVIQSALGRRDSARVLVQVAAPRDSDESCLAGFAGMLKTASLENPRIAGQIILTDSGVSPDALVQQLEENRGSTADAVIVYEGGTRRIEGWQEIEDVDAVPMFRDGGVYLLTGGLGGLGLLCAREIRERVPDGRVILCGRSAPGNAIDGRLALLPEGVEYRQADVADGAAVPRLIASILDRHGRLDGILHAAGVIEDDYLLRKTPEALRRVLAPKVAGTLHLDDATRDLDLAHFVLFSSISAVQGNAGQGDYAAANGFLDWFAAHRNALVARGERRGKTVSIDWPLWRDGGMHVDEASIRRIEEATGARPLQTENGLRVLRTALSSTHGRMLVVEGDVGRLRAAFRGRVLDPPSQPGGIVAQAAPSRPGDVDDLVRQVLSDVLKLPVERIDAHAPFERYGIDSIQAMNLTTRLEKTFGSLPRTLFFEYQSVRELSEHLSATHP